MSDPLWQAEAMAEVEAAEAAVLPRFRCGVYTKQIVLDAPLVAGPVAEDADPATAHVIEFHVEDIEPTPWFHFL